MAKVRLYEDIDGCLNASHNARGWRRPDDDGDAGYERGAVAPVYDDDGQYTQSASGFAYKMEWNSRLISEMNILDVDWVWTTTWRQDALAVGKLMGLTPKNERVLHPLSGKTTFPSIEWKFDAILYEQDHDPSPFIAVDDEWHDSTDTLMYEALTSIGGLVITPDPNIGLTPQHIQKMWEYIQKTQ